jgi:hypothetical protein
MGVRAPSWLFIVLMCGRLGGWATVDSQDCWISLAGGSCGWYWRWRNTVRLVLLSFSERRVSRSVGERARYVRALWVAFWKIGLRV